MTELYLELVRLMVFQDAKVAVVLKLRLFRSWPSSFVYTSRSVRIVRRKGGQDEESGVAR